MYFSVLSRWYLSSPTFQLYTKTTPYFFFPSSSGGETQRLTLSGRLEFWSCKELGALWHMVQQWPWTQAPSTCGSSFNTSLSDDWKTSCSLNNVLPISQVYIAWTVCHPDIIAHTATLRTHRMHFHGLLFCRKEIRHAGDTITTQWNCSKWLIGFKHSQTRWENFQDCLVLFLNW